MEQQPAGPEPEPVIESEPEVIDPEENAALRAEVAARAAREAAALEQFRTALLATEPAMDPGLVTGDSFEAIHASFAAARSSLAKVRQALREEAAARISAGSPARPSERSRSPLEKIREGLRD